MSEEDLAREFLGKPPRTDRRRSGTILGGVGLALFLASGVAAVLVPAGLLAPTLLGMVVALVLLAAGYGQIR